MKIIIYYYYDRHIDPEIRVFKWTEEAEQAIKQKILDRYGDDGTERYEGHDSDFCFGWGEDYYSSYKVTEVQDISDL